MHAIGLCPHLKYTVIKHALQTEVSQWIMHYN